MSETNHFKIWDWKQNNWVDPDEIEELMMFNWRVSGDNVGEAWAELKTNKGRDLEMVFADNEGNIKDPRGADFWDA
jgi:hypothetical protein